MKTGVLGIVSLKRLEKCVRRSVSAVMPGISYIYWFQYCVFALPHYAKPEGSHVLIAQGCDIKCRQAVSSRFCLRITSKGLIVPALIANIHYY